MSTIVIVPKKGVKLPVGECEMVKETADAYVVKVVAKSGRGRGVKTMLRQYVIQKSDVSHLYQEHEITADEAAKYPLANGVKASAKVASEDAPVKRSPGRPKKAAVEGTVAAAPKKRGRPKKDAAAPVTAPKKRGRPSKKDAVAAPEGAVAAAPKKRGRPKKDAAAPVTAPKKRGRPKKDAEAAAAVATETPEVIATAPAADPPAKKSASSLFTDFGS
jgi:hypothetical protein